jgi:hypothetical protein
MGRGHLYDDFDTPAPRPRAPKSKNRVYAVGTVSQLVRSDCPRCGPSALHRGLQCVTCGKSPAKPKAKEQAAPKWNGPMKRSRVVSVADAVIDAAFDRD